MACSLSATHLLVWVVLCAAGVRGQRQVRYRSWKFVGDSPLPISGVQSPSLQLDTLDGGRPYLAFAAPSGGDTYLALVQRLSSRGNWTFVVTRPPTGLGQLASDVGQTQLALHPTIKGRPYAAFADIRGGGQCSVMVYLNSTWRYLGKRAFSAGVATGLTFAMDPKAKPVDSGRAGQATAMHYSNAQWRHLGVRGLTPGAADNLALAISPAGVVHLAFQDLSAAEPKGRVVKFAGGAWQPALGISMAIHPTRGLYVAFRGDAAGAARLAYDNVTVTSYSTAWRAVGPSGFGGRNSLYTSIGLGPDGMPYVAMQCGQQGKACVYKKEKGSATWSAVGPRAGFSLSTVTNLNLRFYRGTPFISYVESVAGGVVVVKTYA
ncbi:hypothetical protein CHLNCDRAFT_140452 [Chlorella variabilis]|uniref:Uncharacterized protein n=1 Tax=Chlorella variabilis TaxID=554065 RepID=E1Z5E9_CHLVA|nr:hypothetical protein CHLNCDRAFT_140452 [Chlorella variabilis]EFN58457.1 hypothetical protein CHLNCDRAFT_140452 [Chlorella variabilis]|eukprot:XP_005850559.1 hypothetical protein CHLNCDRAFT_140452 [Chlorella variabilis]